MALAVSVDLEPRKMSFEEEVTVVRTALADLFQEGEEWRRAAEALVGIPLDSGLRKVDGDFKTKIYLRVAQLYLTDDASELAESFVSRAARLVHDSNDPETKMLYKSMHTQIQDSQRKFLEAAHGYIELTLIAPREEEQIAALGFALNCAILAPAGPKRARILAKLFKDERCKNLPSWGMLEATHLGKIVHKDQVRYTKLHLVSKFDGNCILILTNVRLYQSFISS